MLLLSVLEKCFLVYICIFPRQTENELFDER